MVERSHVRTRSWPARGTFPSVSSILRMMESSCFAAVTRSFAGPSMGPSVASPVSSSSSSGVIVASAKLLIPGTLAHGLRPCEGFGNQTLDFGNRPETLADVDFAPESKVQSSGRIAPVSAKLFLLVVLLLAGLSGCAAPENVAAMATSPAGFWLGLWHGMIAVMAFIVSFFDSSVGVYEVANNGGWYDFGFLMGVGGSADSCSRCVSQGAAYRLRYLAN